MVRAGRAGFRESSQKSMLDGSMLFAVAQNAPALDCRRWVEYY
jgi:hypothetical protein